MGWGQDWGTALYGDPGAPLLDYIEGFEHQTFSVTQFGGTGEGLFDSLQNAASMSYIAGRTGIALHIDDTNVALATAAEKFVPLTQDRVFSGYFRLAAHPSVSSFIWTLYSAAPATQMARLRINTDGTLTVSCVDGSGQSTAADVCDNAWHLIDLWVDTSCRTDDTWEIHWEIDGVAGTTAVSNSGKAATDSESIWLGSLTQAHTAIVDWDDCVGSASAGSFPIGEHSVGYSLPTTDGAYTQVGTNVMESVGGANPTGTDISATNPAFGLLDEWPSTTTDYVRQFTSGAGNYAEVNFADTTDDLIWGVSAIVSGFASSTTTNHGISRIVDAIGTTLVDVYAGDMSATSLNYRAAIVPVPSGGWTPTLVNGLKARVGFSTDVSPNPRWSSLMIQYAVGVVGAPQEMDLPLISQTPSVFSIIRLTNPKATLGLISRVGVLFTPKLRVTTIVGLINRTGTPFAPSKFNQKVTDAGGFQQDVFDDATFQTGVGFAIASTVHLFAPSFPSLPQTVTLPGSAAASAFQDNAFQDEVFQDEVSGGGSIAYVGHLFSLSFTGQTIAAFIYLTGTGGWDSAEITWDDADTDWDAAGLGGQINQSGHLFTPTVKFTKISLAKITNTPTLFAPSVAAKFLNMPFINRSGFTHTPQKINPSITLVGIIGSSRTVFDLVFQSAQEVTVGLISNTPTLFEFQLNPQSFELPLITRVGFPHTPTVTENVTLGLIASTRALYAPNLNAVALSLITQVGVTLEPEVVFNPDDVVVGLIASTVEVFTPPLFNLPFQQTIRLDETAEQFIDNAGVAYEFVSVELGFPQDVFIATIHQEGVAIAPRIFRASFVIPRTRKISTYQPILRLCATYDPILRKEASTLGVKAPITKADAWFVGEDQTFEYLSLTAGLPDNITGWTIQFRMATDDGEPSVLTIAAVLTDPVNGVFQIVTSSASTLALEPDVYYYDVSRLDAGSNQVLAFGPAHLQARVT